MMPYYWRKLRPVPENDEVVWSMSFVNDKGLLLGATGAAFQIEISPEPRIVNCIAGTQPGAIAATNDVGRAVENPWTWDFESLSYNPVHDLLAVGVRPGADDPAHAEALKSGDASRLETAAYFRIWSFTQNRTIASDGKIEAPSSISWSKGGGVIAASSGDGILHVYRVSNDALTEIFRAHSSTHIGVVLFSPLSDNLLVADGKKLLMFRLQD